jgi:hypothetical protein
MSQRNRMHVNFYIEKLLKGYGIVDLKYLYVKYPKILKLT